MRSDYQLRLAMERYGDTVRRICMIHLKNYADTEDIFQTVFLKYALCETEFTSEEHEKAWIIRVAINACKDLLKSFFHKKNVPLESLIETADSIEPSYRHLLQTILDLPEKYRKVIYLYYYEGYSAAEIGQIMETNVNTVYTNLTRARKLLKEELGDYNERSDF